MASRTCGAGRTASTSSLFQPVPRRRLGLPRPVFLYVGRVSYEKNLEAFLDLDLPGTKLVYGVGPLLERLRDAIPQVHWRGVVPRDELLARSTARADVFVFPSRSETFGLVMLEAMACGTPVAAFRWPARSTWSASTMRPHGGVLDTDLETAARRRSRCRATARERALGFDWGAVCDQFVAYLVEPARRRSRRPPSAGRIRAQRASRCAERLRGIASPVSPDVTPECQSVAALRQCVAARRLPVSALARPVSGAIRPSVSGMKGTEDLGSGLKAFFNLEAHFFTDNGLARTPRRSAGRPTSV